MTKGNFSFRLPPSRNPFLRAWRSSLSIPENAMIIR